MSESFIRPAIFFALYLFFLLLELYQQTRKIRANCRRDKRVRQVNNLILLLVGIVSIRLLAPLLLLGSEFQTPWCGVVSLVCISSWPSLLAQYVFGFLLLDCAIYWQHRAMHVWPILWRVHRVHHCDLHLDVSSGVRFHPVELVLSFAFRLCVVIFFGIPVEVLVAFEVLLNAASLFVHSDISVSKRFELWLAKIWVTPNMHRVHHHVKYPDTDRNFSTFFKCWDQLFGTYRAPILGEKIQYGLNAFSNPVQTQAVLSLLKMPFFGVPNSKLEGEHPDKDG